MADVATLSIKVDATDLDKLEKSLKDVGVQAEKTEKKASKTAKALTSFGGFAKKAAIGVAAFGAAATAAFIAISVKGLSMASDMEETQGKFNVVFRGMTTDAEAWSKTLVDSYAMSGVESKKYLSGLQDLLVPTGLARDEAGKLANQFTKMAADLGSFNNLPTSQVISDIQSALQGSSETMAKYGINVKAAKVEQEIFNLGLVKSKADITDAHKAQAIYSIMMREGSDAVGDMARTQESYANQQKKATANVQDFVTKMGEGLLPIATKAVTAFNEWFEANGAILAQDMAGWITKAADAVSAVWTVLTELDDFFTFMIGQMLIGWENITFAFSAGALSIKSAFFLAFDAISEKAGELVSNIGTKLSKLPLVGDKIAGSFKDAAKALSGASTATEDFDKEIKLLQNEHKTNIKNIEATQDAIFDTAKVRKKAADEAVKANKKIQDSDDKAKKNVVDNNKDIQKSYDQTAVNILKNYEKLNNDKTESDKEYIDRWRYHEESKPPIAKTVGQKLLDYNFEMNSALKSASDEVVDAFIAGEESKQAIAKIAGNAIATMAKDAASAGITELVNTAVSAIGALLSEGVAGVMGKDADWKKSGAKALGFLAKAAIGIAAAKKLSKKAKADGGMIESYNTGGWINRQGSGMVNEGSGTRDDVFAGITPGNNTAHYIMGGEFVVNRNATKKHRQALEMINQDGLADGGMVKNYATGGNIDKKSYDFANKMNGVGLGAFIEEWIRTKNWKKGIVAAVKYYASYGGAAAIAKKFGKKILAKGGMITANHGLGDFLDPGNIRDNLKTGLPKDWMGALDPLDTQMQTLFGKDRANKLKKIMGIDDPLTQKLSITQLVARLYKNGNLDWFFHSGSRKTLNQTLQPWVKDSIDPNTKNISWKSNMSANMGSGLGGAYDNLIEWLKDMAKGGKLKDMLHSGTPTVRSDGQYQLAMNERVLSSVDNAAMVEAVRGGTNGNDEIKMLLDKILASINSGNFAIAKNTLDIFKILRQWDGGGLPEER